MNKDERDKKANELKKQLEAELKKDEPDAKVTMKIKGELSALIYSD